MSYVQFRQQCNSCEKIWNAAFGIVGTMQIAAPPNKCPHCSSPDIKKYADGWGEMELTEYGKQYYKQLQEDRNTKEKVDQG